MHFVLFFDTMVNFAKKALQLKKKDEEKLIAEIKKRIEQNKKIRERFLKNKKDSKINEIEYSITPVESD